MAKITIEGSLTPSARLARGERREVQDSDEVRKFIADGFAVVVDEETGEVEPAPLPEAPKPPAKNASKDDWKAWLDSQEPPVEYDPDATHAELIEAWEKRPQTS